MKMVWILYSEALDVEVQDVLRASGITTFTRWLKVQGVGEASGPHMISHIWPKGNTVLMTCVQDEAADAIMAGIRTLRGSLGSEGVKAVCLPVSDIT
jgi:hypothetical protein